MDAVPTTQRLSPRSLAALLAMLAILASFALVPMARTAHAASLPLSQGKTATASSVENGGLPASNAVDGNTATRWSSAFSDPQWLQVDLGATASITSVVLNWETAFGKAFEIQTSPDGSAWTSIFSTTTGTGGIQTLNITGSGRFVRMFGTVRGTQWGYSLFEFQVFGSFGTTGGCGTVNAALNHPASASSTEGANTPASAAFDGNTTTRWSSAFSDPQWLQVDLGSSQSICQVVLNWETAFGKAFEIQTSPDGMNWTPIFSTTTGTGGIQTLNVSGTGRFVRMFGTARGTGFGYSLFEFSIFVGGGGTTTTTGGGGTTTTAGITTTTGGITTTTMGGGGVCPMQSDTPNFGPNVHIFDPSMSSATIQSTLDSVFNAQKDTQTAQFGTRRDALLFKPGTYSNTANIGFYTSIAGLGQNPDDVQINGDVTVDAFNSSDGGNATQNFWRSAENLAVTPSSGTDRWAVAQAAPFRRIHVKGSLNLFPASFGFASGGYIADTKVDGKAASASQQQWYTRDSNLGSWDGSVWNMVFSGVNGAPAQSFPKPPMTTLGTTPVSRDVPYLFLDGSGKYRVFLPSLRTNASGPSWNNGSTPGTSLPMSTFFVASPSDSTAAINNALANGCNVFFTPGVYHLSQTLNVTKANTVVLGIGMPTLIPDNGVNGMTVADVDGVRLKGLLFDAGATNSNALLTVGPAGSGAGHGANPTTIQDVFFRIGGAGAGLATNSLVVNSNDAIIDHIWAWRADHGAGVGWTVNRADNGLTVNGNNVLATGLFVEHYQKFEVQWNGQNGKEIFFQNEMPYDPPNQAAWMSAPNVNGYAAIKVADSVTSFEAWGLGSYCFFNVNPAVNALHSFESPNNPTVRWHDMATVSLAGKGTITHIINDQGAVTPPGTSPSDLVNYP